MRKKTARMVWLVAGGVALGLVAIAATSYVMRLDQDADTGRVPIGGPAEPVDQDGRTVTEQVAVLDREVAVGVSLSTHLARQERHRADA